MDARLKAIFRNGKFIGFDISMLDGDLETDLGLETAIILSLFLDRRAEDDDDLPGTDDRRGYWGDSYSDNPGDKSGSRLWLLSREKQLATVVDKAREYCEEALAWMVEDGVCQRVEVSAEILRTGVLGLRIIPVRPDDSRLKFRYSYAWEAMQLMEV